MQSEVRNWIVSHKELYGKFPTFPTPEEGGSLKVAELMEQQAADRGATAKSLPPLKNARNGRSKSEQGARPTTTSKNVTSPTRPSTVVTGRPTTVTGRPTTTTTARPSTRGTSHNYKRGKKDKEDDVPVLAPESKFLSTIQSSLERSDFVTAQIFENRIRVSTLITVWPLNGSLGSRTCGGTGTSRGISHRSTIRN